MRLEEWLLGHSRTTQYITALVMLGISTWAFLNGWFWPWGWLVGSILLWWSCFGPRQSKRDEDESQ
jgi:hypothetical protein